MNYTYFMHKLLLIYSIIYSPYWIIYIISFCTCFTYFNTLPEIQVYENITVGTIILPNIRNLLGISKSSYIKLGPGSLAQYFRLDNHTGNLLNIASIDLETSNLCSTEKSCCPNHQYEPISNELTNQYYENDPNYYSEYLNNLNHAIESKLLQEMHQCKLMAFILASINGEAQISPIAKLYVNILDLNDNPPEFTVYSDYTTNYPSKSIQLSFLEGSMGVHTKHDLPRAFDADFSPINRVKTYWIEWDNINQLVNNNLQQSPINPFSKLSSLSTMTDSNDQLWSKLGPFRLIYKKSIGNLIIQLDQELDREEQSIYRLRLIAQDGGDLRGSIQLIIEVDDVNEFPPVFIDASDKEKIEDYRLFSEHSTQEVYKKQYRIKESLDVGSRIGQLTAIDRDLSMSNETNNQITYHFGSNQMNWDVTRIFHLDSYSGILTLKHRLDYENVKSYRLTVIAQDGSIKHETDASRSLPPIKKKVSQIIHSSTALIDIIVVDVNDNSPVILFENDYITSDQSQLLDVNDYFTDKTNKKKKKKVKLSDITMNTINKPYEVWIKENVPKGTPIVFFNVIDRDTGLNSRISCQLLNSTEIFSIHELSDLYRIETKSLLDREHIDQYMISIQCNDMGEPMLYNSRLLIIHLIDINDSPPKFPFNIYHFHVPENSHPGTPIQSINTIITATDPDLNNTLTYRLESCTIKSIHNESINNNLLIQSLDYQLFSINSITGEIFTHGELDREKKSSLEFCLCADDGLHSTCSNVIVYLDDVNDNLPHFEHDTYVIHLEENKYYYKPIILFNVTDLDSNNKGFKFNILTDSNKPLDIFKLSLKQQDNIVKQQNEIINSNQIQYNKSMNKNVVIDNDDDILLENGLYLQSVLDREERTNYHFYVQVHDLQYNNITNIHHNQTIFNEYLTSQTEIFIHVTDINDNIPIFIFPNVTTSSGNRLIVSCHEMIGSSIGQIQGYDPDLDVNGSIIYNLIMLSSNTKQLFHLDNKSGELFVNTNELNEYCGKSITVIISIDDQGPEISKIGRHIQMERLIIQLDDKPIKSYRHNFKPLKVNVGKVLNIQ
ncbi:Protocadherin Fat 4 [Schistosoma japonicum]|nr:Protocadherin Fat 4 [Schistosoma japonicum]